MPNSNLDYINSVEYEDWIDKLKQLEEIHDDLTNRANASRKLRYAEVDVEVERGAGRLDADELFIPCHVINTNISREQSPYIQYITQSPRAVICEDELDPTIDLALLEKDLTKKLRPDGWQTDAYSNIDSFQCHGYSVMETVYDKTTPGHVRREHVPLEDFAFFSDSKDLQSLEIVSRRYYYNRTKLLGLCGNPDKPSVTDFSREQVEKIIDQEPTSDKYTDDTGVKDNTLYRVYKKMFRVNGVVMVAWAKTDVCDDWLSTPHPLFVGRREMDQQPGIIDTIKSKLTGVSPTKDGTETQYPYFLYPYTISEDPTITNLKGRVFLDQDIQEAITSCTSSLVTKLRRSAGLYFSRDENDPNGSILMDKNISFRTGAIFNSKVTEMKLDAPDPMLFQAVQGLLQGNVNETTQVNFAVTNRKDSRKTAKEMEVGQQQSQQLTTVQVVLYSIANKEQYAYEVGIIRSRVQAGLITVNQQVRPLYDRDIAIKPSGDTDVIEKQQLVQLFMQSWPVMQNTPLANAFFMDMVKLMFPLQAANYVNILQQAAQAQASGQAQQQAQAQQQLTGLVKQLGEEIVKLSQHPEMFSDLGRIHAYPIVENYAVELKKLGEQQAMAQKQQGQK